MKDPRILYTRLREVPSDKDGIVIAASGMDVIIAPSGDDTFCLPVLSRFTGETEELVRTIGPWLHVATTGNVPVYAIALTSDELDQLSAPDGVSRLAYREIVSALGGDEPHLLGRGLQMARWQATSRYCSACGEPTEFSDDEPVAHCPSCGYDQYPRLSPAMIVSVLRDGKILLGQSPRFRGAFHSVLAGFVEPGESVEDCIHREVFEEAGIRVGNIRYFGSQSWPMPHSLMLAYVADWVSGEITIDQDELIHADWYGPDELPNVPGEVSIAGRMIRRFRENRLA